MPASSHPSSNQLNGYLLGRWFTAARRTGLLTLLSPEVWHTLCTILSFTGRDGERRFTLDQLALALGLSREQARARLDLLAAASWQSQPLAEPELDQDGAIAGARLAPLEILERVRPAEGEVDPTGVPFSISDPEVIARLEAVGLNAGQIAALLRAFPKDRIARQLEWLPAREARNPAALLIRAIEQDWSAPKEAA